MSAVRTVVRIRGRLVSVRVTVITVVVMVRVLTTPAVLRRVSRVSTGLVMRAPPLREGIPEQPERDRRRPDQR